VINGSQVTATIPQAAINAAWGGTGFGYTVAPTITQVLTSLSNQTTNNPSIPACPVANCPTPFTVNLTGFILQGKTALGASYAESEAVFGLYVNTGQPDGQKPAVYIGAVQGPLGGSTWSLNTDVVRGGVPSGTGGPGGIGSSAPESTPGSIPAANSTIGYELDYTNWDQDSGEAGSGGPFTPGMYIHNQSLYPSTAAIYMDSNPENVGNNNYGWHYGVFINDTYTVQDAGFFEATHSTQGFQANGTHAGADFNSNGTSSYGFYSNGSDTTAAGFFGGTAPIGMDLVGTNATETLNIGTSSPLAINISGAHSNEDINDGGTGPAGLALNSTHTLADIYIGSASTNGIDIFGSHAGQDIQDASSSALVMGISGTHTVGSIYDTSTTPTAITLSGTYGTAAINTSGATTSIGLETGAGQSVFAGGTVKTVVTTVSALNSSYPCGSTLKGARALVTDATSPTFLGTLTGGGSVVVPTVCNGTSWIPG